MWARPVFAHLNRASLGRPPPVTMAVCFMPASTTPPKQASPSLSTRVPGAMLAARIGRDGLLGEARNASELGVDRPAVTGLNGDDERDLVGGPAPDLVAFS